MRLKFEKTCKYTEFLPDVVAIGNDLKPEEKAKLTKTTVYEAGKTYDVSEKDGYARRWLRRGARIVTEPEKIKGDK